MEGFKFTVVCEVFCTFPCCMPFDGYNMRRAEGTGKGKTEAAAMLDLLSQGWSFDGAVRWCPGCTKKNKRSRAKNQVIKR